MDAVGLKKEWVRKFGFLAENDPFADQLYFSMVREACNERELRSFVNALPLNWRMLQNPHLVELDNFRKKMFPNGRPGRPKLSEDEIQWFFTSRCSSQGMPWYYANQLNKIFGNHPIGDEYLQWKDQHGTPTMLAAAYGRDVDVGHFSLKLFGEEFSTTMHYYPGSQQPLIPFFLGVKIPGVRLNQEITRKMMALPIAHAPVGGGKRWSTMVHAQIYLPPMKELVGLIDRVTKPPERGLSNYAFLRSMVVGGEELVSSVLRGMGVPVEDFSVVY